MAGGSGDIRKQGWGHLGHHDGESQASLEGPREPQRIHRQGRNMSRKRIQAAA